MARKTDDSAVTLSVLDRLIDEEPKALDEAQNYLVLVSSQWEQALGRLKAFVEKED